MSPRRIVLCLALLVLAPQLQAQIRVDLKISRRLFIAYEPVIATVSITNLKGRDGMLDSVDGQQWFSFSLVPKLHFGTPLPLKLRFIPSFSRPLWRQFADEGPAYFGGLAVS